MKRMLAVFLFYLLYNQVFALNLNAALDDLIHKVDPKINLGMVVMDLENAQILYQRQAKDLFIPASNMKLFSAAFALLSLGPDYVFTSTLSTDAHQLDNGNLSGSLYLYLSGDPSLTSLNLKTLLMSLNRYGINQIDGNIVIVSSHQNIEPYPSGWDKKDLLFGYGAPNAPVILDENRFFVTVNPAYQKGKSAIVELNQDKQAIYISNQVKTADNCHQKGIDFKINDQSQLNLSGCIAENSAAIQERLAIQNPLAYLEESLKTQLNDLRIKLNGSILTGSLPTDKKLRLLAKNQSKPIRNLLTDTLKPSDNLYADSLYLQGVAELSKKNLSWDDASFVSKAFLEKETGIDLQTAYFADGSGLSRNNRVTPEQTILLLEKIYRHFPIAYEYISALPIAGFDGTLQRRFRKSNQRGLIRAKTGTMTGLLSLSGYLTSATGHPLAFTIYINTRKGTSPKISGRYRSLIDQLTDFLLKYQKEELPNIHSGMTPTYQENLSQTQIAYNQSAKWRKLESTIKKACKDLKVTVLLRAHEILLIDHGPNDDALAKILQRIYEQHPFTLSFYAAKPPADFLAALPVLWVKTKETTEKAVHLWNLTEAL